MSRLTTALAASLLIACGGQTSPATGAAADDASANVGGSSSTSSPSGAAGGSAVAAGAAGAPVAAGPTWSAPAAPAADVCAGRANEIASRTSGVHACSTVIRLDYQTLTPLVAGSLCDPYRAADEASARQRAESYLSSVGGPTVAVTEPGAPDLFVFQRSSTYERRTVAINARNNGLVFIAATGNYTPIGDMIFPLAYVESDELGLGCLPKTPRPSARGFDLVNGGPLSPDRVQAAIDAVWHTAVPDGLSQGGYVFDATVLLTPTAYEGFSPGHARYTVIVASGWLE